MASQAVSKSVLITGCSTGIGRATAILLAERGWKVYASARRRESLADLEGKVAARGGVTSSPPPRASSWVSSGCFPTAPSIR